MSFYNLTRQLRLRSNELQQQAAQQAQITSDHAQSNNQLAAVLGVALTLVATIMLLRMVISPIRKLTDVFARLTRGESHCRITRKPTEQ